MKILFIDHVEPDFLAALLYTGLCEELGADNVVDWPWRPFYHGQCYVGPIPYDPPGNHGTTAPYPWVPVQSTRAWSEDEVASRISEFDVVALASPRAYNTAALAGLIGRVGRDALRRLVLIDGEDYTAVRWDMVERFRPSAYFKLSLSTAPFEVYTTERDRVAHTVRLLPIQLASPIGDAPAAAKDLDVAFLGGTNWRPHRVEGVPAGPAHKAALDARLAQEFSSFVGGNLPHDIYLSTLARARIAVCVGGSGLEPLRTYEILSCPGTLLVREQITVISPRPFVDGVDHVAFDGQDIDGLVAKIRHYLVNEPARASIAAEGNRLLREHHTPRARAKYLLAESLA